MMSSPACRCWTRSGSGASAPRWRPSWGAGGVRGGPGAPRRGPDRRPGRSRRSPSVGAPRLYRTGDRARYLPDGRIEFLGRLDRQVKLGGHRIELGEIENALLEHPALRHAAVVVRADAGGLKQLVGYLVGAGTPPSPAELRTLLLRKLPEVMVPAVLVWLDELP